MSHKVVFDNAPSDWNEALPLGNGVFGGMVHYCGGEYHLAMNHYEVYYTGHQRYSRAYREQEAQGTGDAAPGHSYRELVERAKLNTGDYTKEGFLNYRRTIWPEADIPRQGKGINIASMPPTGEIDFSFSQRLASPSNYKLSLDIESAVALLEVAAGNSTLTAETRVLQGRDAFVTQLSQSEPELVQKITLRYPQRRGHEGFSFRFYPMNKGTVVCEVSFYPKGEDRDKYPPFHFVVVHHISGAAFRFVDYGDHAVLHLADCEKEITLVSCVLTELSGETQLVNAGVRLAEETAKGLKAHLATHREHWGGFFGRSAVRLPDAVLEKLWYLNLYVLACSSGKGGRRYEQACGLNGLWDVRQPVMWGSVWYWDVNIEVSFWPVYTANHLELAEAFNDGFLSYAERARKRAKEFYGMNGYAIDYPHEFYNCMWPWCAQYLWWYYEYSKDVDFLREKAYPMFLQQIYFIKDVVQYDKKRDCWFFFPDVSPEQGPIARNSVITVATVKYLLQIALEANRILGAPEADAALFQELLDKLPEYPTGTLDRYGEVLKDSELAPVGLNLRHPSQLMPIYPLYDLGLNGSAEEKALAENTVLFVSEHTELGVFGFGWLSAAAARMGMGNMALRLLYEQGLDIILRANGMGADETTCWINHVVPDHSNLYYPFMMECVGQIVNCVNEMLLQSHDGTIRVFPAIPNGTEEIRRLAGRQKHPTAPWPEPIPENWQNCSFNRLLAKGGFEVSAKMANGCVAWISIHSLYGGQVRLLLPKGFAETEVRNVVGEACPAIYKGGCISFDTQAGETYHIGSQPTEEQNRNDHAVNVYTTHLGRQNFIGKHRNTDTLKLIDSFLYDYYVGNERYQPIVAWRFSFGPPLESMTSAAGCPPENIAARNASDLKFIPVTAQQQFTPFWGYGFTHTDTLQARDEQQMDYLLRCFVEGNADNSFYMELPKGRYEILVVSGGAQQSQTNIQCCGAKFMMNAGPGEYKAEVIPAVQKTDGIVELCLKAGDAGCWRLNLIVVRKLAAYV